MSKKKKKKKKVSFGKGFSAIELLASLVIIAAASGTAYTISMKCMDKVKMSTFDSAALAAITWFENQYLLSQDSIVKDDGMYKIDLKFEEVCGRKGKKCIVESDSKGVDASSIIENVGLRKNDIKEMKVIINKVSGRACVKLRAKEGGSFYTENKITITSGQCEYNFID